MELFSACPEMPPGCRAAPHDPGATSRDCRVTSGDRSMRADVRVLLREPAVRQVLTEAGVDATDQQFIEDIVAEEWAQFDAVRGLEGRAHCQDDAYSFVIFRTAQYMSFPREVLEPIASEFRRAQVSGRNLVGEKYARMMRITDPGLLSDAWRARLLDPSPVKRALLDEVASLLRPMVKEVFDKNSAIASHARPGESLPGAISALDYFMAEVESYGLATLWHLADGLSRQIHEHKNPIAATFENELLLSRAVKSQKR